MGKNEHETHGVSRKKTWQLHGSHAPRSYISPRMAKWLVEAAGWDIRTGTNKETLGRT